MNEHSCLTRISQTDVEDWERFGESPDEVDERQRMYTTGMKRFTQGAASTIICMALALGTAGVASASNSDDGHHSRHHHRHHAHVVRHVEGIVTALGTNSVSVSRYGHAPVTYTTTPSTTYFYDKTAATLAALAVGENVHLVLTPTTPQTVTKVEIDLVNFEGTVTALGANTITLANGRTVTVSPTTTFTLKGVASTFGAITLGSWVHAEGVLGSTPTSLNAVSVNFHDVE